MNLRRVRELCLVAAFTVVLFLGLSNLGVLLDWVRAAMSLLMPFLIGVVVAFILNRVMIWLEKRVLCRLVQGDSPKVQKRRRGLALLSTYLLLLVAILVVVCIVAPQLTTSVMTLARNMNGYLDSLSQLGAWMAQELVLPDEIYQRLTEWFSQAAAWLMQFLVDFIPRMLGTLLSVSGSIVTFVIGLVVAAHILLNKEQLLGQARRLCRAFLPRKAVASLSITGRIALEAFGNYLSGQLLDAAIVGVCSVVGLSVLGFPYAMLIGVVMGITNIIPFYGPFIGAVPGVLLLLMVEPIRALWYIVFVVVLQQIDGNIIAPKIIGGSVGLPPLWVLFAVTVGGGIWGVPGMVFGTPLFAVIYRLLGRATRAREERQRLRRAH